MPVIKSIRLLPAALVVFLPLPTTSCNPEPDYGKPNVVFIMADDLGYAHLGSYGQEKIRTPNLDRLAEQGVRFTQFYSGSTVCAPARSVLMTGLHAGHTAVRGNTGGIPIEHEDITVAEVLKEAGYATGVFGKWGLGDSGTTGVPWEQGFDEFFGYLHQVHAHFYYTPFLWENDRRVLLPGNEDGARTTYSHDVITERALQFVRDNSERPFFLYLAYTVPHTELLVPEESFAEYDGQFPEPNPYAGNGHYASQDKPRTTFAAMVDRMDRDVGRLMRLLNDLGIAENTMVFFTSDNGGQDGWGVDLDFFAGNAPLRGGKMSMYEGGIRVPLLIRWLGRVEEGKVSDHVWAFWDVLPTLAELVGGTVPDSIDGISMLPAILGTEATDRDPGSHEFLYWEYGNVLGKPPIRQAVRWGNWKAVRSDLDQPIELYDLGNDVGETTDVAEEHPEVVATILEYLAAARVEAREYGPDVSTYRYVGQAPGEGW